MSTFTRSRFLLNADIRPKRDHKLFLCKNNDDNIGITGIATLSADKYAKYHITALCVDIDGVQ
jgi:hypothetical protein